MISWFRKLFKFYHLTWSLKQLGFIRMQEYTRSARIYYFKSSYPKNAVSRFEINIKCDYKGNWYFQWTDRIQNCGGYWRPLNSLRDIIFYL